jgi:hypothetical protein
MYAFKMKSMEAMKNAEKSSYFDVVFGLPANSNGDQIKTLMPTDKFTFAIHDPKVRLTSFQFVLTTLLKCQARLIELG